MSLLRQKKVLLVWVHGFKGDETTFVDFPKDFTVALKEHHPDWDVQHVIYPKYKTVGELSACTDAFVDWVEKRVAFEDQWDAEADFGSADDGNLASERAEEDVLSPEPHQRNKDQQIVPASTRQLTAQPPSVRPVYTKLRKRGQELMVRMGGLLVADAASKWSAKGRIGKEPPLGGASGVDSAQSKLRIRAVIALDTPFIGIHPSLVSYGVDQLDALVARLHSSLHTTSTAYIANTPAFIRNSWKRMGAEKWLTPPGASLLAPTGKIVEGAKWGLGLVAKGSERGSLEGLGLPVKVRDKEEETRGKSEEKAKKKEEKESKKKEKEEKKKETKEKKKEEQEEKQKEKKEKKAEKADEGGTLDLEAEHEDSAGTRQQSEQATDGRGEGASCAAAVEGDDTVSNDPVSRLSPIPPNREMPSKLRGHSAALEPPTPVLSTSTDIPPASPLATGSAPASRSNSSSHLAPPSTRPASRASISSSSITSSRTPSVMSLDDPWDALHPDFGPGGDDDGDGAASASTMSASEAKKEKRRGWKWLRGHMVFISALWRTEEVWRRMRLIGEMQDRGLRFTNIYTLVPPEKHSTFSAAPAVSSEVRTFISLPAPHHATSSSWQPFEIRVPDQVTAHMALFMKDKNTRYDALIDTIMNEVDASLQ